MAEIIWTGPAAIDLREIAEYIALDNPMAAEMVVRRIVNHVRQLERHPRSGSYVPEVMSSPTRQLVEPPCRIFYRIEGETVYILHLLRFERLLRVGNLQSLVERSDVDMDER